MPSHRLAAFVVTVALATTTARAINIQMDYSFDTFFASHPTAKAALDAAAADISAAITTSLGVTQDSNTGANNNSSVVVSFNYDYDFNDPTNLTAQSYNPYVVPADTVIVYAGVRGLSGSSLGVGGPGSSFDTNPNFDTLTSLNGIADAVNNAAAAANANVGRGAGPTIGSNSGNFNVNGVDYPFQIDYGSAIGTIAFDNDTDNMNGADSESELNAFWHFDHTAPVPFEKFDFYSVAVHELVHAIGFGTANSWDDQVSGTVDWLGSEVIALLGTGTDVLHGDSSHIKSGTMSPSIVDGAMQEAALDPSITNGERKYLTELDLAFLRDMGWETITITAPGDFDGDGDVDGVDVNMYIGLLGTTVPPTDAKFDLDADNDVDIDDYNLHVSTLMEWSNAGNGQSGAGTLLGDTNRDGEVSLLDLNALGVGFGNLGGWAAGDSNGDGDITLLDLNALGLTFGQDVFVAPEAGPAVPEPTALALLGFSALVTVRRRR